jgi:ATP-dependent Clp protease ATP-binding subunit ClpC
MTGIPAERISHNEAEQLRSLATHLRHRVIGQGHATDRIAKSLLRARSGLKDRTRPIGVFLLIGPTGVGKTLLAKELSQYLFDQRRGLIRLDMSEYSERHNVARLIGSPPGYVGHGEGGQLTEAVRRQPYAVILFDEIDKAHSDIFNTMLQIFDEGHLTDGSGRKVDFRNTIIIMTSNAGARNVQEKRRRVGYSTHSKENNQDNQSDDEYQRALESTFSPEFLNRIDETVLFRPLTIDDIELIINLELDSILKRTREQGYTVEITAEAKRHLATIGYDSQYGARALRRTLRTNIEEPLSSFIIEGRLRTGGSVEIWHDENEGLLLQVA